MQNHPRLVLSLLAVTACSSAPTSPAGPPEGPTPPPARIAFSVRLPSPDSMPIYVVQANGTAPRRIVEGPGTRYGVAWSPSRTQLAYIHSPSGSVSDSYLRLVNDDGTHDHAILGPGTYQGPVWSPDGSTLLVSAQDSLGIYRITAIDSNGAGVTTLTTDSVDYLQLSWSPDGTQIAYISNCRGEEPACHRFASDLWVRSADGLHRRQLTFGTEISDDAGAPEWSPDGEWLAFHMNRDGATNLYRIRPTGADLTQLTFGTDLTPSLSPSYSPDGTRLLFTRWLGPNPVDTPLYLLATDGTGAIDSLGLQVGEPVGATWAR